MDRPVHTRGYRSVVYSTQGMCATSQPLATLAGIEILKSGGNAVDAAICMLNTLTVVEPFMTGLGGDMFGLYFDTARNELVGLNSSGPAPMGLNAELIRSKGHQTMPIDGPLTITVPGALAGLAAFRDRYGKVAWEDLFGTAIEYANGGFPVTEIISSEWNSMARRLRQNKDSARIYLPDGKAPRPGDVFVNKPLARTLSKVAKEGPRTFYQGELAEKISQAMASHGSPLSVQDLTSFAPEWVQPLSVTYHGREVFEVPPNSQGITVLEMLRILEGFDLKALGLNTSKYIHLLAEAKKFAFFDRDTKLGDPRFVGDDYRSLLCDERIRQFRTWFNPDVSSSVESQHSPSSTVYVVAVDKDRNVASFISSIFELFGSGIVAGDTGILMQNRGSLFSLDKNNPNYLERGKRPLHTIIPAMVFENRKPQFAFGLIGGHMQPQGHVQILNNIYVFDMGIQEACDQPRFFHDGLELYLESSISYKTQRELIERGHKICQGLNVYGGFQGIWLEHSSGILIGGSDPRKDGCAIGY